MQTLECFDVQRVCCEVSALSQFLRSAFKISSRKDQLVGFVRENLLMESLWSSYFRELDSCSDEQTLQALRILVAIILPENQVLVMFFRLIPAETMVPQYETFSPTNRDFLMQLMTLCDSVLHTYLSKITDSAEKRNHLHVLYSAGDALGLQTDAEAFLNDVILILEPCPPTFQPCMNPRVLLHTIWRDTHVANYLRDFLRDPERSGLFYYDPGLWSAVVAARYIRYLRITFKLR